MSRLLCVVAAMLLVTAAMAAPGDVATATGTPQLKTSATPLAATAEFKATVATYASIVVTPPTTLAVPGDSALGVAGSAVIEPDLNDDWDAAAAEHGGLVEVSANDKCYLHMQVTEFNSDPSGEAGERLWSLVKVGSLLTSATSTGAPMWLPPETGYYPDTTPTEVTARFVQVIDHFGGWDSEIAAPATPASLADKMPWAEGGTYVIKNLPINPSSYDFRYLRLFWGTKAYNRVNLDCAPDIQTDDHVYETLAAKGDYVATVTATLTADQL
jgi:hypothetical protein